MIVLSFISFLNFMVYLGLAVFTLSKAPKAKLNIVCSLIAFSFAIWAISDTFTFNSILLADIKFWSKISPFGWIIFPSLGLWFSLIFTKQEKILKNNFIYFIIFLIPLILLYQEWTNPFCVAIANEHGVWITNWKNTIWTYLYYAYYISFMIFFLYLCWDFSKRTKLFSERRQAQICFYTGITPLLLGTVTNVLLPVLGIKDVPGLGLTFVLIWVSGMVYAITKYKFMVPTIAYAAQDILLTMTDSLILTNPEGKIVEINNATLNMIGYTREDIIGKPVGMLFGEEKMVLSGKDEYIADRSTNYVTKAKEKIPVDLSGSIVKVKNEDIIGVVYIARDRRETIKSEEEKGKLQKQILQSEKTIAVAQLAGGVAHEINNPMGVILGFTQSIVKKMEESDFMHMPLKSIERETIKCKRLIDDLLNFSRMEQNTK